MYDRGQGIRVVEHPSVARGELMDYLRSIGFDPQRAETTCLGKLFHKTACILG
jgi:hypothetical protein